MPNLSAFIPDSHRNISAGYVETLIQTRREDLFTGLMRLSCPSGPSLMFVFLEGVQLKLYRCLEDSVEVVSRQSWFDELDQSCISAGFIRLPLDGLRFVRVASEAPVVRVEPHTLRPEGLIDSAKKWSLEPEPSILHIHSTAMNKYCLLAGQATPLIEELSFVQGDARFAINDASFSQTLPRDSYSVTRYVSSHEHDAWREYELRLAFGPLMRMLLKRFSELAGRTLTERLCERLSTWTRTNGWNVAVTGNGVVNRHYFDTLQSAVGFYVDLVRYFQSEAGPALGARMTDGIAREVLAKMDPYHRELLTRHIYSQSGAGGVTSAARR
jgi:hypothetical protein